MALKEGSKQETHVLMVTLSSQGHINPMLRLGKRLVEKGLHVTLATTEFGGQRMLKASAISSTTGANFISGIRLLFFPDGFSLDYDRSNNLDHYMEYLAKIGPVNLSNLIKEYYHDADKKLSCIISNPFVSWVVDAAWANRVPCALLWIQPCSLYAIYYRFYNKLNPFPTLTNPDMRIELPGLPLLHSHDLPSFVLPTNPFRSFPWLLSDMFQNMKRHKWVLANSFFELEKEVIDSMAELCPIQPVGPLVPPSLLGEDQSLDAGIEMWKPDETSLEWLNNQPPASVIYVSFGSIIVLPVKLMEVIATALKNTNHPFLLQPGADGLIGNEDVENCIKQILRGPKSEELQKNAAVLKQAAREAVASGGSSDRNIQLLVNEIVGSS
ncbi:hypothetical protein QQP08_006437 [Theobroma cacao]|nr:hypothetical protein QQP08_006437 [Theobroma cacao]